ncbi:MAG: DUF6046 domain-containing protein [Prevotellaceae bacterium]|jgi:hypothetical protein|nr:DUF6046 domain-containing protein [Prevotellaceae bacterium]
MGQILINIAGGIVKRTLHIATLDNMRLGQHPHANKSKSNPYLNTGIDYENMQDDNVTFLNEEILRVPSDGYAHKNLFSMPRNNIIIEDINRGFKIEFLNAKCKVVKQNTIVETAVVNRDGTVKEFINAKDYSINISGDVISDWQYNFPVEEMKTLIGLLNQKTNMKVESAYLGMFGISQVIFKQGTFDQTVAHYVNTMPFSLEFASDENYEFLVEDNN